MDDAVSVLNQVLDWRSQGRDVALATVINTWGSAPRRTGSLMCIDTKMQFTGSVSGGCVETAVISEALQVIKTAQPRLLEFGVSNEQAWEVGLACGGNIEVYLRAVSDDYAQTLTQLVEIHAANRSAILLSELTEDNQVDVITDDRLDDFVAPDGLQIQSLKQSLENDRPLVIEGENRRYFAHPFNPQLSLYVVGGVHIAQQLIPIVAQLGFKIHLIDPRSAFANKERFPDVELTNQWPDKAFKSFAITHRSAIIALTHDPKFDDPALCIALNSPAFYIGALGSRKTHAARLERLAAHGFDQQQLSKIHAPIGLDIKAANPAEIAVSIAGEIVKTLRQRD